MSAHTAVNAMLLHWRQWWQTVNKSDDTDRTEIARFAQELGMTANDLLAVMARGPDAANLLHQRMQVLGLSRADVRRSARDLMCDLERTCAFCKGRRICAQDLGERPFDPNWKNYCPNAATLEFLTTL
jgi:hypothetical protein